MVTRSETLRVIQGKLLGGRNFIDHPKDRVLFDAAVANALHFPEPSLLRLWKQSRCFTNCAMNLETATGHPVPQPRGKTSRV